MVQNDKKNSVSQSLYLRNHTSYIWLSFMGHMCKMKNLQPFFFFFFFKILIFWVVRMVKVQKTVQNDKKIYRSNSISQEPYIIWLSFLVHMCKNDNIFRHFFHFFKILIFQVFSGVKVQKMVGNDKKFSSPCSISQEPYIWLSFMVHMWKMMSPGVFFIFQNLDFAAC